MCLICLSLRGSGGKRECASKLQLSYKLNISALLSVPLVRDAGTRKFRSTPPFTFEGENRPLAGHVAIGRGRNSNNSLRHRVEKAWPGRFVAESHATASDTRQCWHQQRSTKVFHFQPFNPGESLCMSLDCAAFAGLAARF